MSPITASQIEEAAGLREKKPRKVKASEIERVAGFEQQAPPPEKKEEKKTSFFGDLLGSPAKGAGMLERGIEEFEKTPTGKSFEVVAKEKAPFVAAVIGAGRLAGWPGVLGTLAAPFIYGKLKESEGVVPPIDPFAPATTAVERPKGKIGPTISPKEEPLPPSPFPGGSPRLERTRGREELMMAEFAKTKERLDKIGKEVARFVIPTFVEAEEKHPIPYGATPEQRAEAEKARLTELGQRWPEAAFDLLLAGYVGEGPPRKAKPKPEPTVTPTEIPVPESAKPGPEPRLSDEFPGIPKGRQQFKTELSEIDKMNRLQANEELLRRSVERGLSPTEAGNAIAKMTEEQVKDQLRLESTETVARAVFFGEQPKAPKKPEVKTAPEPTVEDFAERIVQGEKMATPEDLQFYENNAPAIELELKTRAERGEKIVPPKPATELSLDDYIAQETGNALRQPGSELFKKTFEPGRELRIRPKRLEEIKEEYRQLNEDKAVAETMPPPEPLVLGDVTETTLKVEAPRVTGKAVPKGTGKPITEAERRAVPREVLEKKPAEPVAPVLKWVEQKLSEARREKFTGREFFPEYGVAVMKFGKEVVDSEIGKTLSFSRRAGKTYLRPIEKGMAEVSPEMQALAGKPKPAEAVFKESAPFLRESLRDFETIQEAFEKKAKVLYVTPEGEVVPAKIVKMDVRPEELTNGLTLELPNGKRFDIEAENLLMPIEEQLRRVVEAAEADVRITEGLDPDMAAIARKNLEKVRVNVAKQAKPEPVDVEAIAREVEAAQPKPGLNPGTEPTAAPIPIEALATDVDRFQNRMTEFAPETVQAIVENYDPNKFDPIVVWKDPANGETYVLSGHSRLEGMKQRGETDIPARYFQGTAEEAARFATIEANRLATKESLPETIRAFRKAKEEGLAKTKMRDLFGSDVEWLEAVQNLDPKGQFLELLGQPPSALESFPYIKRFARWVGELRSSYGDKLTNFHEQQLFDFLYKTERKNMDISKENFFHLVSKQLDTFDWTPERPLSLKRTGELLSGTKARGDTAPAEAEIERLKALQEQVITPTEHQALQREIDRIRQSIAEMVKNQGSLFEPAPAVQPKFGESNAIFTKERLDAAMNDLGDPTKIRAGLDPKLLKDLLDIGGYYIEGGIREFAAWSKEMLQAIPPTYHKAVEPHLKALYSDLIKIADSRDAALNRLKNEAEITMNNVKDAIDQIGEAERLALRELDHLKEEGHFPTEVQEQFKELTPFPEEVIRKTLVSPDVMASKSSHFADRLEATANMIDELGLSSTEIGDILEKNVYSTSAQALRKLVGELKESSAEFAKVGRSASYSLLERKKAIERFQALAYKLGPIKDQIGGIKWVKSKEPVLNHFYKLLTDAKFRKETTGAETLERAVRGWTSNLFRLFSFTADFVGNSVVGMQQALTGAAKDVGRIVQEGTYDYFGRPYGVEEVGAPTWSYTKEFFNSWKKAKLLDPQRNILSLPPEVRVHLGYTLFGEAMGQRQPRLFLESEKFPKLAKAIDYAMAGPSYAKMHVDQLAKAVAAEAELSALADIQAGKLGLKQGTPAYEEFTTLWRQKLPPEAVQQIVRRAQEASFSVEFQSPFAQQAGRVLSHPITKLMTHPFLFWKMQFTRWMLESLAPLKATKSIWRDSRNMPTQAAVYKNLPELFSDVTKAATGWGGLWLLKNLFLDNDNEEAGRMDFTRMRYVFKDGSYVNLGSIEPIVSGLLLNRLLQWTDEDDPKKREEYKKDFEAGFKYSSILGLGAQGQEGLVAGLLPMALNLAGTENYGYRAKRDFDRFLVSLIPGNALLTSLNSLMEKEKREGALGKFPLVSRFAPHDIDPTTGEPKQPEMQFPPAGMGARLFGFRSRTLEGAPVPASRIIPTNVQAILEYAGQPLYPSWTLNSVAGYGAVSDAPDDVRRDWLVELGQARQEFFRAYGWTLDDIRDMDAERGKELVRHIDNLAVNTAQQRMNAKYGTPSQDVGEFYLRGPRIERRRMQPEEAR